MKPSSRTRPTTRQTGYALILMVIAMMGIGGVVITGFTQDAKLQTEHQRYLHNQRILKEAKQALLQYAYNYPQMGNGPVPQGPGRLPCPDIDIPGSVNSGLPNSSSNCIDSGIAMVGRFPWKEPDMHFYEAMDASGEPLWYAVSSNFAYGAGTPILNSDTTGTITIADRSGAVLRDGAANNGVAAVIIAPGAALARGVVMQDRVAGPTVAANYLDLFGTVDNADFVNNNANGFVTGPIFNPVDGSLSVNDQMIVITAAEVIAMAEKATLQAYRDAIFDYRDKVACTGETPDGSGTDETICLANGGVWDPVYPWLDPYDSADGLATYDAQINPAPPVPIIGRVPSIFGNYFTENEDPTQPIVSEMTIKLNIDGHPVEVQAAAAPGVQFKGTPNKGDLVAPFDDLATFTGWVWDGSPTQIPTFPVDGIWEACPYVTGTEEDCNQDAGGNFVGGVSSPMWLTVRKVTFTFSGASPFVFPFADRVDLDPVTGVAYVPPSATSHAYVEAEFDGLGYITAVAWEEDEEFEASHDIFPPGNVGPLTYDAGDSVTVGIRYYPELPRWALTNGWHDMLQGAYSSEVQPGGDNVCTPGVDCLTLQGVGGITNNKRALLVLSGGVGDFDPLDIDLTDAGSGPNYYADDLNLIFEDENNNLDRVFDNRPTTGLANDVILQME